MATKNGSFVISLDFELMWGVRDVVTKKTYGNHIAGVHTVLTRILECFQQHNVTATFAAVGFLFCKNKNEILQNIPAQLPSYTDKNLLPYGDYIEKVVGFNDEDDPYHYGWRLLDKIENTPGQEIGTHTFCHYYCLEEGQTIDQFEADLLSAIEVAGAQNIELRSIIFPRNQVNEDFLNICKQHGIRCYRGTESSWIYKPRKEKKESLLRRAVRLTDAYINLSGHNCHSYHYMASQNPYNIASSRFLRPFSKRLARLEWLRLRRIKNSMTYAAKNTLTYHLWWHPHNFGINQQENIMVLEKILTHYLSLNKKYGFESITMASLAKKLDNLNT